LVACVRGPLFRIVLAADIMARRSSPNSIRRQ